MTKIATFNVNSIRSRIDLIATWLDEKNAVDILCMQELKCEAQQFPKERFEKLGYEHIAINGQKRYNGVAICSKIAFNDIKTIFDDDLLDSQKRLVQVIIGDLVILNVYAPHGDTDEHSEKYQFKMDFYDALHRYIKRLQQAYQKIVLVGDLNVALEKIDVYDPELFKGKVGFLATEKEKLKTLLQEGLLDCYRQKYPDSRAFTWWDYRTAGIWRDEGMRIDYILATEAVIKACKEIKVDLWTRRRRSPTPSDHAPLVGMLDIRCAL